MNEPLLTTSEAAKFLSVRAQTLRVWRSTGRGPSYVRLGTGKFARAAYSPSELRRWVDARSFTSTSDETTKGAAGSAA